MSDPRVTPNGDMVTQNTPANVSVPVADLCRTPEGPRDRQLLFGDAVTLLDEKAGWSYVQAHKDSYCGFVLSAHIGPAQAPTHKVIAPATHAYPEPDFKSQERISLSYGSLITTLSEGEKFAQTAAGHIPVVHLAPVTQTASDPAAVAAPFLGTPYLWGGNSRWGIDCSGLIQAALLACGLPCPGDSDMQMTLGTDATGPYQRNDLLFWKGHVALVTDADTLIHANAHAMSTTYEPIDTAITRIAAQGDGPVTAHRRL